MLTSLLFLAGFMAVITAPGLIALHLEEKRDAQANTKKAA